jgi:Protein of unknown function (DUF992)
MRKTAQSLTVAAGAAFGALMLASTGHAQPAGIQAGTLACNVGAGWGYIIGSSRPIACTYSGAGAVEHYVGQVSELGVDLGYLQGAHLVWQVIAPTAYPAPGSLAGQYSGVTGSAAVGPGVGANVLVGGSNRSFTLQPLSFESEAGVNIQAGLQTLTLQPAP